MRCYKRLLKISYKDHVINEDVRRKIQPAVGEYKERLTLVKKWKGNLKVVWPHLKVFCLSKDNSAGHSEWKIRGRQKK